MNTLPHNSIRILAIGLAAGITGFFAAYWIFTQHNSFRSGRAPAR